MGDRLYVPIMLDITGRVVTVIGGGRAALQKVGLLLQFNAIIRLIGIKIKPELMGLNILFYEKAFEPSDLEGSVMVYACTNNREINRLVAREAQARNIPVNACDMPSDSDFISPAVFLRDSMCVAVSSMGKNVKRSIAWRDKISEMKDVLP